MKFEINIEGPSYIMAKLHEKLKGFSPVSENPHGQQGSRHNRARIRIIAYEENIDEILGTISRRLQRLEVFPDQKELLKIRVRNLAYSEPPAGSSQFRDPFNPISSITIQPWNPSISRISDPGTIVIDSGNAFGTGMHPTTRLCLECIDQLARADSNDGWIRGKKVLDFGCGTGLLAIASVKMGAESALGVELDHQSVKTARSNVRFNGLNERVVIREGSWELVSERFDIVLVNLVIAVLLRTGKEIPFHLKDGGMTVISGFGEAQLDEMETFFTGLGLVTTGRSSLEGWGALVMGSKRFNPSWRPRSGPLPGAVQRKEKE